MTQVNVEDVRRFYRWLDHRPDEYTEIRIIKWPPPGDVKRYWVQNERDFTRICKKWSGKKQVYCGLNPRSCEGGANEDVSRVIAIPFDVDSSRPSDMAATNKELAAAKDHMIAINSWMKTQGYQQPLIAMSGNGFHILQRINIPLTDELTADELSSKLEAYFFDEVPTADKMDKLLDAARILKVPGTMSVKGVPTDTRPHRLSFIISKGESKADKKLVDHILSLAPYVAKSKTFTPTTGKQDKKTKKRRISRLRPCFKRFAEEGGTLASVGSEDNLLRLGLVIEAHSKGYSRAEIIELFALADDFDQKTTRNKVDQQLGKIAVEGQKAWSCKAIHKHGGCLGELCNRYKKHVAKYLLNQTEQKTPMLKPSPFLKVVSVVNGEPVYGVDKTAVLNHLKETFIYKTPRDTEQLYLYDKGFYKLGETHTKGTLEKMLGDYNNKAITSEIIAHLTRRSYCEREEFNRFEGEIPVLNGLLNLDTMQLEDFDPEKIFTFKVNTKFDSSKDCPKFKVALKQILPKVDERALIQEYAGYTLLPAFPYHDFIILVGGGRNGKGVIIRTITGILGQKNVSNIRLEHFGSAHKFIVANLFGKLMNVCAEPSTRYPFKTEMLKQITGQDMISASVKFKQDLLKFTQFAKVFIQANKLPQIDDITLSFWDRVNIIGFTQTFTAEQGNRTPDIENAWLNDEDERSGVLNWMIEGLTRLKENNGFTQTESKEKQILKFKQVSDPIGAFLSDPETCIYGPTLWIRRSDMYEAYKKYAEEKGVEIESIRALNTRIRLLPSVGETHKKIAGKSIRIWTGISTRSTTTMDDFENEKEQEEQETAEKVAHVAHVAPIPIQSKVGANNIMGQGESKANTDTCDICDNCNPSSKEPDSDAPISPSPPNLSYTPPVKGSPRIQEIEKGAPDAPGAPASEPSESLDEGVYDTLNKDAVSILQKNGTTMEQQELWKSLMALGYNQKQASQQLRGNPGFRFQGTRVKLTLETEEVSRN